MNLAKDKKNKKAQPVNGLYTIPNALTVGRGVLGPVIAYLITLEHQSILIVALGLMIVAEISDYLDGVVARKLNQESELGRVLDPICDSIYHLSVFMAFLHNAWLSAWMLFIIYTRDLSVPYIRSFARQIGEKISVRESGKIKTATHAFSQVGIMLVAINALEMSSVNQINAMLALGTVAVVASLYSLWDYVYFVWKVERR